MAARAHYMRIYILYLELRARQCPEPSQVIVRRSRQHPGEGYRNVMVRIHQRVPFAYFIVECPFPCEFIRIRPYQSGRLARPMELYEQSVSCRTFQYLFLNAYHLLVIAVHEVHHESPAPPIPHRAQRLLRVCRTTVSSVPTDVCQPPCSLHIPQFSACSGTVSVL